MGFYCVDNLPVDLIPIFAELHSAGEGDFTRAALLVDAREGAQLDKLPLLLKHLRRDHPITLVFIDASEDSLVRRYSETRRPHPLGKGRFRAREPAPGTFPNGADPQAGRRGHRHLAIQRARAAALHHRALQESPQTPDARLRSEFWLPLRRAHGRGFGF